MVKKLRTLSKKSIEKLLTGLTKKTGLTFLFIDNEDNKIMSSGASYNPTEEAGEEVSSDSRAAVFVEGELIGDIYCNSKDDNQEQILKMAAYCIETSFRFEDEIEDLSSEIVRVYQELSLVYSLSSKLGSELEIKTVCQEVVEEISKVLDVRIILILLLDPTSGELSVQSSTGIEMAEITGMGLNISTEPFTRIFANKKATVITEKITADSFPIPLQDALCVPLVTDNRNIGILIAKDKTNGEEFHTPEIKLIDALSGEIAAAIKKAQLYENINRQFISTVEALASAIDAKDPYTFGHSKRVAQISSSICKEIGMSTDEIQSIKLAALLHDIGKIGTPEYILLKPGRLKLEELSKIQEHPLLGAQILSKIVELNDVGNWIKHHHERYDGNGYPDKRVAEEIPLPARIISIADSFDAMTSDRPYRKGMDPDKVMDIMNDLAGSQYDPFLFNAFKSIFIQNKIDLP